MISDDKRKVLDLFAEGRRLYKQMQFKDALEIFDEALTIDPNDGPSITYSERCKVYIKNPPPENWDGVFVMKTK